MCWCQHGLCHGRIRICPCLFNFRRPAVTKEVGQGAEQDIAYHREVLRLHIVPLMPSPKLGEVTRNLVKGWRTRLIEYLEQGDQKPGMLRLHVRVVEQALKVRVAGEQALVEEIGKAGSLPQDFPQAVFEQEELDGHAGPPHDV